MTQEQQDALSRFVQSTTDGFKKLFPLVEQVQTLVEIVRKMAVNTQKLQKAVSILIEYAPDDVQAKIKSSL